MADRVLLGTSGGAIVARVSKPAKSVYSTNLDDFLLHESFLTGIPLFSATVTSIPNTAYYDSNPLTVAHGLGFVPFVVISGDSSQVGIWVDSINFNLKRAGWIGDVTLTAYNIKIA